MYRLYMHDEGSATEWTYATEMSYLRGKLVWWACSSDNILKS